MTNKELDILEKAFAAEIEYATNKKGFGIIQTKSKVAIKLVDDGYLERVEIKLPGYFPIIVRGYALTIAGNMAYCSSNRCEVDHDR